MTLGGCYSRLSFGRITTPSDSMPPPPPYCPDTSLDAIVPLVAVDRFESSASACDESFSVLARAAQEQGRHDPRARFPPSCAVAASIHHHHPAEKQTFAQENTEHVAQGQGGRSSTAQALKRGSTLWKSRPLHRDHIAPHPTQVKGSSSSSQRQPPTYFSLYILTPPRLDDTPLQPHTHRLHLTND